MLALYLFFSGVLGAVGIMDLVGTTTCLSFLGFFVSLLPRICPLAMLLLLKSSALKWFVTHADAVTRGFCN